MVKDRSPLHSRGEGTPVEEPKEKDYKLTYKIVGRRKVEGDALDNDYVDIEWSHSSGPIQDTVEVPKTHPPHIQYETQPSGTRDVIKDTIIVPSGTPTSRVKDMIEEKRPRLAASLGLEE